MNWKITTCRTRYYYTDDILKQKILFGQFICFSFVEENKFRNKIITGVRKPVKRAIFFNMLDLGHDCLKEIMVARNVCFFKINSVLITVGSELLGKETTIRFLTVNYIPMCSARSRVLFVRKSLKGRIISPIIKNWCLKYFLSWYFISAKLFGQQQSVHEPHTKHPLVNYWCNFNILRDGYQDEIQISWELFSPIH